MKSVIIGLGIAWVLILPFLPLPLLAQSATREGDFLASDLLAGEMAQWINGLENRPNSVALYATKARAGIGAEFSELLESKVIGALRSSEEVKVIQCFECRTPQLELLEDRLIVKKGASDAKSMRELSGKLGTESLLVMEIYRTKLAIFVQAMLYSASNGDLLASRAFRAPSLQWYESAMLIKLTVGPGVANGGKERVSVSPTDSESEFGVTSSLAILEEIGFGKGGLLLSYHAHAEKGYLGIVAPTLGWRGYFRGSNIYTLKSISLGFAESNNSKGLGGNLGYDVFIGSFTNVGLAASFFGGKGGVKNEAPIRSVISAHIGLNFGF